MTNVENLIAEIKSDLSKYDSAGLLDNTSMYRDIYKGLKRFGNNIMNLQETVLEVKNGVVPLPAGFFSLYAAYLCEPKYYKTCDIEFHDLQASNFYRERIETSTRWNDCSACCEVKEEKVIKENIYLKTGRVEFHYHNPRLLTLGKSFEKSACHSQCRNKFVRDNPNEISIIRFEMLQANFNAGSIYMQYYGLPLDDEGNIDIPSTPNDHLDTFLEYHLKRRSAERLLGNNDAQALANLYQVYKEQEAVNLRNASRELQFMHITPNSMQKLKRLNRLESLSFELNFQ